MARSDDDGWFTTIAIFALGAIALVCAFVFGCTDEDGARRVLESQDYTNVVITGWDPAACGDDWYETGFTAKNAAGHDVVGAVCKGFWAKKATLRFG